MQLQDTIKYILFGISCIFALYLACPQCVYNGGCSETEVLAFPCRIAIMLSPARLLQQILMTTARKQKTRVPPIQISGGRTSSSSSTGNFTYRLSAASASKHTPLRAPKAHQDYFSYASTHPIPYLRSTKADAGEDAFFATTVGGSANNVAFGVADGVGGWQDQGVDPSEFSHGLCGYMAGTAYTSEGVSGSRSGIGPMHLLQTAYDAVTSNPRILAGGSTAVLAVANEAGDMECANLGDSGFLHLAPQKIVYRSAMQTHAFNTPYQLAKIPKKMQAQHAIFGGNHHYSEVPSQADVTRHTLRHGDVVVFATDGVWDNLTAQEILEIVTRIMTEGNWWFQSKRSAIADSDQDGKEMLVNTKLISAIPSGPFDGPDSTSTSALDADTDAYLPSLLAKALLTAAKTAGLDHRRNGPFAKEVNARYPQEGWRGGKPDDIAIVVCVAVQDGVDGEERPLKAKL